MSTLRDAAIRRGYRIGWRVARPIPDRVVRMIISYASRRAARQNGRHVQTLRRNLSIATGESASDQLVQAALESYLRTQYEVLALPGWSPRTIIRSVEVVGELDLRSAFAERGAVVALPHSGNWDLVGAWACLTGLPVTTVAEELGGGDFEAFAGFRRGLGMEVLSHRDPAAISTLVGAVHRGRVVCLLADRDLAGGGLPVLWHGQPITMPAGPAIVARRSGAALVPAVCQYAPRTMRVLLGTPVAHRPGRDGLVKMTQELADFFAARIAEQPQDWHLMQPFFAETAAP